MGVKVAEAFKVFAVFFGIVCSWRQPQTVKTARAIGVAIIFFRYFIFLFVIYSNMK